MIRLLTIIALGVGLIVFGLVGMIKGSITLTARRRYHGTAARIAGGAVIMAGLAILLVIGSIMYTALEKARPITPESLPETVMYDETEAERYAAYREGFTEQTDTGPASEAELAARAKIETLFEEMQRYILGERVTPASRFFNNERMLDTSLGWQPNIKINAAERKTLIREMSRSVLIILKNLEASLGWHDVEVRRIDFNNNQQEAIAYVRVTSEIGLVEKVRFWLIHSGSRWEIYDLQVISSGIRQTLLMSIAIADIKSLGKEPAWFKHVDSLQAVGTALIQGDVDLARQLIVPSRVAGFPPPLEAINEFSWAVLMLHEQKLTEALVHLDRAEQTGFTPIYTFSIRAQTHYLLENYEQAIQNADTLIKLIGDDGITLYWRARANYALGNQDEAINDLIRGLNDSPRDIDLIGDLGLYLPDDRKSEFAPYFTQLREHQENYLLLAAYFVESYDTEALRTLNTAYSNINPTDFRLLFYTGVVEYWSENYEKALTILRLGKSKSNEDWRADFESQILYTLIDSDQPLQAYIETSDKHFAFPKIANSLVTAGNVQELKMLVDLHQQTHPDDVMHEYYRGEYLNLLGEYDEAEAAYLRGYQQTVREELKQKFAEMLTYNRWAAGRPLEAYGWLRSKEITFTHLANLMISYRQGEALAALCDLHAINFPDDPELAWNRILALIYQDKLDAALLAMRHDEAQFLEDRRADYESNLITLLCRLERFPEAMTAAKASTAFDNDRFYEAYVAILSDDVALATQLALEQIKRPGYSPDSFYNEPDLSEKLMSDHFAPFREAIPPPAAEVMLD